ncbi:hypothetical protein [Chryseobacterium sp.]|uniref:hypothetical protein n=1 Tax=Chryseobacterium sp. TaxID=1871047 RepID=UPI0025B7C7CA|nr:hypothetical protein [Chryseobacterium sp.]
MKADIRNLKKAFNLFLSWIGKLFIQFCIFRVNKKPASDGKQACFLQITDKDEKII